MEQRTDFITKHCFHRGEKYNSALYCTIWLNETGGSRVLVFLNMTSRWSLDLKSGVKHRLLAVIDHMQGGWEMTTSEAIDL